MWSPMQRATSQVQVARVREFREKNLLLADEDFAFAFSLYDEAVLAGGDFLGQEWARCSSATRNPVPVPSARRIGALMNGYSATPRSSTSQPTAR